MQLAAAGSSHFVDRFQGYRDERNIPQINVLKPLQKGEPVLECFDRFPTEPRCYVCVAAEKLNMKDLAAACLSQFVIAILCKLFALFLLCNKKYQKRFSILFKTITSR